MKTFVVIGLGRFGETVVKKLFEMGHEVLAIDKDERAIQKISNFSTRAVIADAKDEDTLRALGVKSYHSAIVSIGSSVEDSVLITLALKDMGMEQVICKARNSQHKKILLKIGADKVILPEHDMGIKLAVQLATMNFLEFVELSENFSLSEIKSPKKWVGKSLQELDVRRKYKVTVIAIKNSESNGEALLSPPAEYKFKETDILVIVGKNSNINEIGAI